MPRFASLVICSCAAFVAACNTGRKAPSDTTASAQAGTPAGASSAPAATASIAQLEGTWQGRSMPVDRDSTLVTWTLSAGSDTAHWATTFSTGTKAPMHLVAIAGDSFVSKMGPYKSATMKGQLLTADVVTRVRGDSLFGTFVMHTVAEPAKAFSHGRIVATRAKP